MPKAAITHADVLDSRDDLTELLDDLNHPSALNDLLDELAETSDLDGLLDDLDGRDPYRS